MRWGHHGCFQKQITSCERGMKRETVNLSPNLWFLYAILIESKQNLFPSDLLLKGIEFEYKPILFNIKNDYLFFNFGELDESKFSVREIHFLWKLI